MGKTKVYPVTIKISPSQDSLEKILSKIDNFDGVGFCALKDKVEVYFKDLGRANGFFSSLESLDEDVIFLEKQIKVDHRRLGGRTIERLLKENYELYILDMLSIYGGEVVIHEFPLDNSVAYETDLGGRKVVVFYNGDNNCLNCFFENNPEDVMCFLANRSAKRNINKFSDKIVQWIVDHQSMAIAVKKLKRRLEW